MNTEGKLVHRNNYLLTEEFLDYLWNTKKKRQQTVDRYRFWLRHMLLWAMEKPLESAKNIKPGFSEYVNNSNQGLESRKKIIETVRSFFTWAKLHHEKLFMGLPAYWINDLTPPTVKRGGVMKQVTYNEIVQIARLKVDKSNVALWRDQSMAAMLYLSGARAGAAVTLPVKAVHLDGDYPKIDQDPDLGVKTKNGKSATTFLNNIPALMEVVQEWDAFVRSNFPDNYPWYAPLAQQWGVYDLSVLKPGENRNHALIKRLNIIYKAANLSYKSPHKFRHGYALYGLERCQSMAQYNALSRNLMHANIAITDGIYVHIEEQERGRLIREINHSPIAQPDDELHAYLSRFSKEDLKKAIMVAAEFLAS